MIPTEDTSGHVTNAVAALACVSPWIPQINSAGQLVLTGLGIAWLALQITLKLISLRKKP